MTDYKGAASVADNQAVDKELCPKCKKHPAVISPCPYQKDINNATDAEAMCACCDDCRYECAMDI